MFSLSGAKAPKKAKKEIKRAKEFQLDINDNNDIKSSAEASSTLKSGYAVTGRQAVSRELAEGSRRSIQAQLQVQKKTLAEDESAYDYDAVYDQMKQAKLHKVNSQNERDARYVGGMMKQAHEREKDNRKLIDRRMREEAKLELSGVDPSQIQVFVTDAYKLQQEEMRRLEAAEKKLEEAGALLSSKGGKEAAKFYRSLIDARASTQLPQSTQLPKVTGKVDVKVKVEVEEVKVDEKVLKRDADGQEILRGGLNVLRKPKPPQSQQSHHDNNNNTRDGRDDQRKRKAIEEEKAREEERQRLSMVFEEQLKQSKAESQKVDEQAVGEVKEQFIRRVGEDRIAEAKRRAEERRKAREAQKQQQQQQE